MEFRLLRTFEVVASFLSFNQAASVLHCTQSTVSAQIKALEDDLGTQLFDRLGRRVVLTSAGEELLRHTRRLLSYEQEVRGIVANQKHTLGMLTVRVPQSVAEAHMPPILARFHDAYPRVGFDLSNCGYYHLADELRTGVVDAAFLLATAVEAPDLHTSIVLQEPMVYVAGPRCALARRARVSEEDLEGQTLLVPKHDCGYRMELERGLRCAHVDLGAILEMNSLGALLACLKTGLGVALLPERVVAQELTAGHLRQLRWHEPTPANLFFIRHRDKPLVGAYGTFVGMVEEHFAELRRDVNEPASGVAESRRRTARASSARG